MMRFTSSFPDKIPVQEGSLAGFFKDPFSHFDFDGVLGLGLQTLALSHPGHVDPRDAEKLMN